MRRNNKGFTLVELLAVIVILGLLMAIAIPSVTKYITQSRKKTLISTMDSYVTAVTTSVNDNEFGAMSNENTMFYIPVSNEEEYSCVTLEKGGTNPFGNWKEAYVVVNYDSTNYSYNYYFTFYDDAGYGMELTKIEDIDAQGSMIKNPSPVNANNITKQKNDRATKTKVLDASTCDVENAQDVVVEVVTFSVQIGADKMYFYAEKGMTWEQWVASEYNTTGFIGKFTIDNGKVKAGNGKWVGKVSGTPEQANAVIDTSITYANFS